MLDLVIDQWSTFLYLSIQYDGHLHDYKINSTHYVHHRCHQFQRLVEAHKYFINDHPDHNICFVAIHWRDRCQPMTPDNIIFCHKTPHTRHPVLHTSISKESVLSNPDLVGFLGPLGHTLCPWAGCDKTFERGRCPLKDERS